MLTALISSLVGIFGGVAPDLLKEWVAGRQQQREAEFLQLQNQLQLEREKAEAGFKMQEAQANEVAMQISGFHETLKQIIEEQSKPSGVRWIDALNAMLRPITCICVMVLFMCTATIFVQGEVHQFMIGQIKDAQTFANIIWNSMIGDSIQAVLGFLFGYRSSFKR